MESSPLLGIRGPKASERLIDHSDSHLGRDGSVWAVPKVELSKLTIFRRKDARLICFGDADKSS